MDIVWRAQSNVLKETVRARISYRTFPRTVGTYHKNSLIPIIKTALHI